MKMHSQMPAFLALAVLSGSAWAQQPAQQQTDTEKKALAYLLTKQGPNGAWLPEVGPAVTAMVVKALVQSGKTADDPALAKALAFIQSTKQKDGGFYKDSNPNYNSAIVLSTFAALQTAALAGKTWSGPGPFAAQIAGLQKFLESLQLDESKDATGVPLAAGQSGKAIDKKNSWYGGSGYGGDGRPDLSNTAFFIEALHDSGVKGSDPAIQKALLFVTRSQMNGETNDQPFAKGATDGGFIYTPVGEGDSKFGDIDSLDGTSQLRSYGTMTYSGFKSLLYAGLGEDDPRVKAAVKWISANWTLDFNAGSGGSMDGKFYYLQAMSKALNAYHHDEITDAKGVKHNWRNELNDVLKSLQNPDGSFVNKASNRWLEGEPVLATAYAALSLQEARK